MKLATWILAFLWLAVALGQLQGEQPPDVATQDLLFHIATKVGGGLSVLGSGLIVASYRRLKKKDRTIFKRIVLFMSCNDILGSLAFFIGIWTVSSPTACTIQGWVLQFNLAVPIWSACLASQMMLKIGFRVHSMGRTAGQMEKYMKWFAISSWGFPLITATAMLFYPTLDKAGALGAYGPTGPWCWVTTSFQVERFAFFYIPLWICMAWTVMCVILMMRKIKLVRRHSKIAEQPTLKGQASSNLYLANHLYNKERQNDTKTRGDKTKEHAEQKAIMMCLFFVITWAPGSLNRVLQAAGYRSYWIALAHGFFVPLQGFLNFIAYSWDDIKATYSRASGLRVTRATAQSTNTYDQAEEGKPQRPQFSRQQSSMSGHDLVSLSCVDVSCASTETTSTSTSTADGGDSAQTPPNPASGVGLFIQNPTEEGMQEAQKMGWGK